MRSLRDCWEMAVASRSIRFNNLHLIALPQRPDVCLSKLGLNEEELGLNEEELGLNVEEMGLD